MTHPHDTTPATVDSAVPPHMRWADALGVAVEPSPDAWAAAFAYLYSKSEQERAAIDALLDAPAPVTVRMRRIA